MQDVVSRTPALVVHRPERSARVRPLRPVRRRGRVRDLPLPDAAGERARLLLLARPRDRRADAPLRVVRHQVARGARRRARGIKYLISFVLPRFCDQTLERSRKAELYGRRRVRGSPSSTRSSTSSITSIPQRAGIRQFAHADGTRSPRTHGAEFYEDVAEMVARLSRVGAGSGARSISCARISRAARRATAASSRRRSGISRRSRSATWSRAQRCRSIADGVKVEPLKPLTQPALYTEDDLHIRQFTDAARGG